MFYICWCLEGFGWFDKVLEILNSKIGQLIEQWVGLWCGIVNIMIDKVLYYIGVVGVGGRGQVQY